MIQTSCGNVNGHIKNTDSWVKVEKIGLSLDSATAWALCNLLTDCAIKNRLDCLETDQIPSLSSLGAVIGRIIDHPSKNNCGSCTSQ